MTIATDVSPLLRRLISTGIIPAHPDMTAVSGADLDALRAILHGALRPGFDIDRKRALELLARSAPSAETAGILAEELGRTDAHIALRLTAAYQLRRLPPALAEPPLLAALKADDARLRRAVVAGLGQLGGKAAQEALATLPETPEIASAKLLIGLREGSHKGGLRDMLGVTAIRIRAEALTDDEAAGVLDAIGGHAGEVALTTRGAIGFACRAARHVVLLAEKADLRRAGILAAVINAGGRSEPPSLRYLVLVSASKEESEIALVTPAGRADYIGHGKVTRNGGSFHLRDTASAPAPLNAEARLADGGLADGVASLEIELFSFKGRAAKRRGRALPVATGPLPGTGTGTGR